MMKQDALIALSEISKKYLNDADNKQLQEEIKSGKKNNARYFMATIALRKTKPLADEDRKKLQDIDYYGFVVKD